MNGTPGLKVLRKTAKPLVTFNDQFYKGQTAATRKDYGKGSVTFLGVCNQWTSSWKEMCERYFQTGFHPCKDYPEGVIIDWHKGLWIGVNYSDKPYKINKDNRNFLIGTNELQPAGVSVWRD
jgi:beta-galactosidase